MNVDQGTVALTEGDASHPEKPQETSPQVAPTGAAEAAQTEGTQVQDAQASETAAAANTPEEGSQEPAPETTAEETKTETKTEESKPESASEAKADGEVKAESAEEGKEQGSTEATDKGKPEEENSFLEQMRKTLMEVPGAEERVELALHKMEEAISQAGSPHFKGFWDVRKICLEFFKENMNPAVRARLWTKYHELTQEARRLKEILDEQSAFAVEQIELAIQSMEEQLKQPIKAEGEVVTVVPESLEILKPNAEEYKRLQGDLEGLNAFASRINSLRKELIRTEMRIRFKNKFFQRLSALGDRVFPLRKELIKEVSVLFSNDVENFVRKNFQGDRVAQHAARALFALRESIKELQGVAKALTLNTSAFTETRKKLSQCWDIVKVEERDRKKVRLEKRAMFKEVVDEFRAKLNTFKEEIGGEEMDHQKADKAADALIEELRNTDVPRDLRRELRAELDEAIKPVLDRRQEVEKERQEQARAAEMERKAELKVIQEEVEALLTQGINLAVEELQAKREEVQEKLGKIRLQKVEKQGLEKTFRQIKELLEEKKEQALLDLPEEDRAALDALKQVLKQRTERRTGIKEEIEKHRKACNVSGMDFAKAMHYEELMAQEKESLDKVNKGIEEIERKIKELKAKS